jgi:thiol-disulfide isomerase/thioredoxin
VAEVEQKAAAAPAAGAPDAARAAMGQEFAQFRQAHQAGDTERAVQLGQDFMKKYPTERATQVVARALKELTIEGGPAAELDIDKWYQGKAGLADGEVTLLVFWESWCPHCKREVPKLEATYQKYKGQGLNLVGLTKVTKSATDETVEAFIQENKLTYPVAKETGKSSEDYAVNGVPAAAAVKDGKVIWRGHPGRLTDATIEGWLGS